MRPAPPTPHSARRAVGSCKWCSTAGRYGSSGVRAVQSVRPSTLANKRTCAGPCLYRCGNRARRRQRGGARACRGVPIAPEGCLGAVLHVPHGRTALRLARKPRGERGAEKKDAVKFRVPQRASRGAAGRALSRGTAERDGRCATPPRVCAANERRCGKVRGRVPKSNSTRLAHRVPLRGRRSAREVRGRCAAGARRRDTTYRQCAVRTGRVTLQLARRLAAPPRTAKSVGTFSRSAAPSDRRTRAATRSHARSARKQREIK